MNWKSVSTVRFGKALKVYSEAATPTRMVKNGEKIRSSRTQNGQLNASSIFQDIFGDTESPKSGASHFPMFRRARIQSTVYS